jgi:hypothetical protein
MTYSLLAAPLSGQFFSSRLCRRRDLHLPLLPTTKKKPSHRKRLIHHHLGRLRSSLVAWQCMLQRAGHTYFSGSPPDEAVGRNSCKLRHYPRFWWSGILDTCRHSGSIPPMTLMSSASTPWRSTGGSAVPIKTPSEGFGLSGALTVQIGKDGCYVGYLGPIVIVINIDGQGRCS